MFAIVEREMRKFFRSPALMMVSMTLPLVQLVILGNAFGGKIRNARMGVVDYDHGSQALKIHEAFDAIRVNIRMGPVSEDRAFRLRSDLIGGVVAPRPPLKVVFDSDHDPVGISRCAELQYFKDHVTAGDYSVDFRGRMVPGNQFGQFSVLIGKDLPHVTPSQDSRIHNMN
jgi:hypothetical protein